MEQNGEIRMDNDHVCDDLGVSRKSRGVHSLEAVPDLLTLFRTQQNKNFVAFEVRI